MADIVLIYAWKCPFCLYQWNNYFSWILASTFDYLITGPRHTFQHHLLPSNCRHTLSSVVVSLTLVVPIHVLNSFSVCLFFPSCLLTRTLLWAQSPLLPTLTPALHHQSPPPLLVLTSSLSCRGSAWPPACWQRHTLPLVAGFLHSLQNTPLKTIKRKNTWLYFHLFCSFPNGWRVCVESLSTSWFLRNRLKKQMGREPLFAKKHLNESVFPFGCARKFLHF